MWRSFYRYHRNMNPLSPNPIESSITPALASLIRAFLTDLRQANHSPHTLRAYASDLAQFASFHTGATEEITAETLRSYWNSIAELASATRSRKQAALSRFLTWAYRHEWIPANPMDRIDRVRRETSAPRGVGREAVETVLSVIPKEKVRDRLLFRLVFETGLRIGEALGLHVEDLDLNPDDEHLNVVGKGGKPRTVLLDDPSLVRQLRGYLKRTGYRHGPLFRAEKNGRGGPLRYQSVQERWSVYCRCADIACTLHQLRHTHATELVNEGVSLATIRKRLGHKNLQTTLRYAEQSDQTADAELRAWRRKKVRRS